MVSQTKGVDFFGATFRATSTDCDCFAFIVYYHYVVGLTRYPYRTPDEIWKGIADEDFTHSCYDCHWDICQQLFS